MKDSLRERCVRKYGEDFGRAYDRINMGVPIGGFTETVIFLDCVNRVRKQMNFERKAGRVVPIAICAFLLIAFSVVMYVMAIRGGLT